MKMTQEKMMLEWLQFKLNTSNIIASHEIQLDFPRYIQVHFGKRILPDSASRLWRKVREGKAYQNIGIENVVKANVNAKETYWDLRKS